MRRQDEHEAVKLPSRNLDNLGISVRKY
ncbi:hypothetical protein CY0110_17807 [Crocosphaera chwakensis CCY0110]|uniref:Uncharacterized protein n=1 Tax=Crocosphaera chwakensis CCY0110 TaxID=391612 RepID=A3IIP3_9CHRO|nr:hypothetical protein CY0110_17807 [Crocosphaera chwakensis CCY0110]